MGPDKTHPTQEETQLGSRRLLISKIKMASKDCPAVGATDEGPDLPELCKVYSIGFLAGKVDVATAIVSKYKATMGKSF